MTAMSFVAALTSAHASRAPVCALQVELHPIPRKGERFALKFCQPKMPWRTSASHQHRRLHQGRKMHTLKTMRILFISGTRTMNPSDL